MASLSRFISKSAERYLPFFKILRQMKDFTWMEEYQKAFDDLKQYLGSPPLLTKPNINDELSMYLVTTPEAISSILVQEENKMQNPIY